MALKTVQFNQIQKSRANYKDIQKVTFKKAWWRRGQKVFIQVNTADVAGSQTCPILGAMRKSLLPDTSRCLPHQPERGTGCSSAAFLYWKRTGRTVFHTVIKSIFFWAINKDFSRRQRRALQLGSCYCAAGDLHKISYALRIFSIELYIFIPKALEGAFLWNFPRTTQSGKEK